MLKCFNMKCKGHIFFHIQLVNMKFCNLAYYRRHSFCIKIIHHEERINSHSRHNRIMNNYNYMPLARQSYPQTCMDSEGRQTNRYYGTTADFLP